MPYANDIALANLESEGDLRLLERWVRSPHIVRWWGNPDLLVPTLGRRSPETHALIIADRKPVGYLCWQRLTREEIEAAELTDLPEDLVDIDILIGEPEYLGRGVGPEALRLLLARLGDRDVGFAGLAASRGNHAAIRAYEKAGFRFFRDFDDPDFGPCVYMVAPLRGASGRSPTAGG